MSRPAPTVLTEKVEKRTYMTEQVLESEAVYSVFYKGSPINLRTKSSISDYPSPRYKKVSFSNSGHAFNLRDRLNKKFNTDEFTVVKLVVGEVVDEDVNDIPSA